MEHKAVAAMKQPALDVVDVDPIPLFHKTDQNWAQYEDLA